MKTRFLAAIVALSSFLACPNVFAQADTEQVHLLSGPFGTSTYVLSNALEQISKSADMKVSISASETPGLVYNRMKIDRDPSIQKNTIIAQTSGINVLAKNGEKPFRKKHEPVKVLAYYHLGTVWLATFNQNLRTPEDLVSKRIALGRAPQILWAIEPLDIIRDGWGLEDKIDIQLLGTKQAAQALQNGSVDAAVVGGYVNPDTKKFIPSPQTVELAATGRQLYFIPWGTQAVKKAIAAGASISPLTLPAGVMEGMDRPLTTFYDPIAWTVSKNFDQKSAYRVTKLIIGNVQQFKEFHALGKLMNKKSLIAGWSKDQIAPGALRAYREAGLLDQ